MHSKQANLNQSKKTSGNKVNQDTKNRKPDSQKTNLNNFRGINFSFGLVPIHNNVIQPKLFFNKPGDDYEKEADAVADKVLNKSKNIDLVQNIYSSTNPVIQRKCAKCEEEEKLQLKPLNPTNAVNHRRNVRSELHSRLQNSAGKGSSLPRSTISFMNEAIGNDFSSVSIHTGHEAIQMNAELNARAFTYGSDIYFNRDEFRPDTMNGKRLIAHELAHVVQQNFRGTGIQMQRRAHDPNVYETDHNGSHYRVRRTMVPRTRRGSRPQSPNVGVDVDADNVTLRISWCQGTRGEVRIGANLTGQALSLAKSIAGIITRGGSTDEVLEELRGADVTPFVETVVAKSGEWRIFIRGDVTVGASGVTAGSGRVGIRRGPVDVDIRGQGNDQGGSITGNVTLTPGRRDETFDCPREVTVRQTYVPRYTCERLVPAHEETRTRTRQRTDEQVRYIYFNFANATIDENRSQNTLADLEDLLSNGYKVTRIQGFTSPEGPEAQGRRFVGNTELAQNRADAALSRLQQICATRDQNLLAARHCIQNAFTGVEPAGHGELYGRITQEDGSSRELRGRELQEHTVAEFGSHEAEAPHRSEEFMQSLEGLTPQQQADRIYPLLRRAAVVLTKEVTEQYQEQVEVPSGYQDTTCPEEVLEAARINFNLQNAVRSQ